MPHIFQLLILLSLTFTYFHCFKLCKYTSRNFTHTQKKGTQFLFHCYQRNRMYMGIWWVCSYVIMDNLTLCWHNDLIQNAFWVWMTFTLMKIKYKSHHRCYLSERKSESERQCSAGVHAFLFSTSKMGTYSIKSYILLYNILSFKNHFFPTA